LRIDAQQTGAYADNNLMAYKDTAGMTKHEKVLELHKRAARRNFLKASSIEKEKIRERYKPENLR